VSASRAGRSLPPGKSRYPLYRRLGGPQGRSGHVRKILPPRGFEHRTVQNVASRYTDYSTRPTNMWKSWWDSYSGTECVQRTESHRFFHICKTSEKLYSNCFIQQQLMYSPMKDRGPDSVVGIATGYGLDGPRN